MNDESSIPEAGANDNNPAAPGAGVSMMITRRQRAALLALGFSEAAIFAMTPAQAHALLGLAT